MAQAYPQGYRRAHPGVAAWYIRPDTVRRHWSGSTRSDVNRFIHWMDRELVPLQEKRNALARAEERAAPRSARHQRRRRLKAGRPPGRGFIARSSTTLPGIGGGSSASCTSRCRGPSSPC